MAKKKEMVVQVAESDVSKEVIDANVTASMLPDEPADESVAEADTAVEPDPAPVSTESPESLAARQAGIEG